MGIAGSNLSFKCNLYCPGFSSCIFSIIYKKSSTFFVKGFSFSSINTLPINFWTKTNSVISIISSTLFWCLNKYSHTCNDLAFDNNSSEVLFFKYPLSVKDIKVSGKNPSILLQISFPL